MAMGLNEFEFAQGLETKEDIVLYLSVFLEDGGIESLLDGLRHLIKSKGMTKTAMFNNTSETANIDSLPYNPAEYLTTAEDVKSYLEACLEENDPQLLLNAFEVIKRSKRAAKLLSSKKPEN